MATIASGLRTRSSHMVCILASALVFAHPALNQTVPATSAPISATKPLAFEVASVKENKTTHGYIVRFTPDGVVASGVPLKMILQSAYSQYSDQFWSGIPSWLESTNFDIEAKFDLAVYKDPTDDQRHAMLQALLADRFKLAIHIETRDMPEYALVITKGGPHLREANPATLMHDDKNQTYCRAGTSAFLQCTMAEFARDLRAAGVDRIVVDKTGLAGRYDFDFRNGNSNYALQSADTPPTIYEALQDKFGLKLEPTRGPIPVFVVDHIERPSGN